MTRRYIRARLQRQGLGFFIERDVDELFESFKGITDAEFIECDVMRGDWNNIVRGIEIHKNS